MSLRRDGYKERLVDERIGRFMCVIIGHLDAVMIDPETGIYITPLTSLRP